MARIYLSYRRRTATPPALAIANGLRQRFGRADVFINTGNPDTGSASILPLAGQLRLCRVMLVLIDPAWAGLADVDGQRRLDDPHDQVRREVEAALLGTVRVIPLLLDGAELPDPADLPAGLRALCELPALRLNSQQLDAALGPLALALRRAPGMERWRRLQRQAVRALPALAAVLVVGLLLGVWQLMASRSGSAANRAAAPVQAAAAPLPGPALGRGAPAVPAPDPQMQAVPGGSFTMGSPGTEWGRFDDEGPQHPVSLSRFEISATPVTRGQFAAFVADTHYSTPGCTIWAIQMADWIEVPSADWQHPGFAQTDAHPVVCVNWADAQAYARWLGKRTGRHYRLPSESEWEYAARAGTATARYWGDEARQACRYANVADRTTRRDIVGALGWPIHDCADGYAFTAPADFGQANALGLHGVLGNVWQWTEDCWHRDYTGAPTDGQAWTGKHQGDCGRRLIRGGGWGDEPRMVRSAARNRIAANSRFSNVGFRIARSLP